ncbi:MAG: PEGA domain-containing protein [Deltaproteobacteria bacterium]|nr:PEGA domain-containing protein [Deltaproteobacteria bacterium]
MTSTHLTRCVRAPLFFAVLVALGVIAPVAVDAQDAVSAVASSALVIPEGNVTEGEASIASIGLRRGITEVQGVRFIHPVDVLSPPETTEDLQFGLEELESRANQLRDGDAADVAESTDALVDLFEQHLDAVRREQLVDAYMINALARCRMGQQRECESRLARIFVFREGHAYDAERYPADLQATFDRVQARVTGGARTSLEVITEPAGAEVYIDGRSYGPSPARADDLLVGDHYVTIKMLDRMRLVQRVNVARSGSTERLELQPNPRARLVASPEALSAISAELGETRAGANIRSLGSTLGTAQVVIARLVRAEGATTLDAYLYDVRTRFLLAHREATIEGAEEGIEQARLLAVELYQGVDLSGTVEVVEETGPERRAEPWEEWWFWTSIGAAVVAVGVGVGVGVGIASQGPAVPEGWTRIEGTL